jgi:hypothetical protein
MAVLPFLVAGLGSLVAIPFWLVFLAGLKLFGGILSFGGLLAYACSYWVGLKIVLEKVFDINVHGPLERPVTRTIQRLALMGQRPKA